MKYLLENDQIVGLVEAENVQIAAGLRIVESDVDPNDLPYFNSLFQKIEKRPKPDHENQIWNGQKYIEVSNQLADLSILMQNRFASNATGKKLFYPNTPELMTKVTLANATKQTVDLRCAKLDMGVLENVKHTPAQIESLIVDILKL
jgi:hypothetical protein